MEERLKKQVVIAGAGPAGSSLAIRLARSGHRVVLLEKARFPRHKLCGEFISPECLDHFRQLGVLGPMNSAGGDRISKTVFYSMNGRSAEVPSHWFGGTSRSALGLSRAEMDKRLMDAARDLGVEVMESTAVRGAVFEDGRVQALNVDSEDGNRVRIDGEVFVDATGRQRILSKCIPGNDAPKASRRSAYVGFKSHLRNVGMMPGRCEIYFFPGGYGGLNYVEGGSANHCFLMKASYAREFKGDADRIVEELVLRNARARQTLSGAEREFNWIAVAVDGFGVQDLNPAQNVFTVGDAGAFIDPFTGSGMLMALESAELLGDALSRFPLSEAASAYSRDHRLRFRGRLRLCSVMRRLSFSSGFAGAAVAAAGVSESMRKMVARNTRAGSARASDKA